MSSGSEEGYSSSEYEFIDGENVEDFDKTFQHSETNNVANVLNDGFGSGYSDDDNFEIICAMRYCPSTKETPTILEENFFLFKTQWQRFKYTLDFFGWKIDLPRQQFFNELKKAVEKLDASKPYKMRVAITNSTNSLKVQAFEVNPRINLLSGLQISPTKFPKSGDAYRVFVDPESSVVGPFTSFKTTRRSVYTKARERMLNKGDDAGDPRPQEVLLFNSRDEATEGSITNVAFKRDGQWVTPPLTSGCLCGAMRHYLISNGILDQDHILRETIEAGEPVLLFNGVIGVCFGIIEYR